MWKSRRKPKARTKRMRRMQNINGRKDEISMEEFLSEKGNGLNIMRKINKIREEKKMEKEDKVITSQKHLRCKERQRLERSYNY